MFSDAQNEDNALVFTDATWIGDHPTHAVFLCPRDCLCYFTGHTEETANVPETWLLRCVRTVSIKRKRGTKYKLAQKQT